MATVTEIVGYGEAKTEDAGFSAMKDLTTSPRTADPVIYHLVRVVGDGTLVPATDDEVMEVEDFLEDDKIEDHQLIKNEEFSAEELDLLPDLKRDFKKMDIHEEDKSHQSAGVPVIDQSSGCSIPSDALTDNNTASTSGTALMPNFSLLEGEIHLDNLTMKELQETFRATFGRETSVKDKQWLKRRIIMGLTNSCDFSATTLVIRDNKVVKKSGDEICNCSDPCATVDRDIQPSTEDNKNPTSSCGIEETHSNITGTKLSSLILLDNSGSKDDENGERPAKRVRKPTRRYIEELSEGESRDCGAKEALSVKQSSSGVCVIPVQNSVLDGKYLTRQGSLGGSGVEIPYVSRIRRSRPRENLTTLLSTGMQLSTKLDKDVELSDQFNSETVREAFEIGSSSRLFEVPVSSPAISEPLTESKILQMEKGEEPKKEKLQDDSDDEAIIIATENGGTRRKHHRPWTLNEVVKLVEGVAKYGVGRWSEIKRSAFASPSYRTSVDLKDKWRNLLRASLAGSPARNGMQTSRKHAAVPIPARILVRVRELADNPLLVSSSLTTHLEGGFDNIDGNKLDSGSIVAAL